MKYLFGKKRKEIPILRYCGLLFITIILNVYSYQTRNAIVLVIDGSRYTETFGDSTHRYIPRMWNELRPLGTIFTRLFNDSVTYTCPGHATILTGLWQNIENSGSDPIKTPTIFEYYRKERAVSAYECFVILGKPKLDILASSVFEDYGPHYGATVKYCEDYSNDINTWNNIREVLTTRHPRLSAVNLGQVDYEGHSGDWQGYLGAIRQADSIVGLVWELLQSDPFYKDSTTLFVVNDHGRHSYDFTGHGDTCQGCRHLLCMMIGPDVGVGVIDSTYRQQVDIAPTIGKLLRFPTPFAIGHSLLPEIVIYPDNFNLGVKRLSVSKRYLDISYALNREAKVSITVSDLLGRTVVSVRKNHQRAGYYNLQLDLSKYCNGCYVLDFTNGRFSERAKVIF